MQVTSKSGRADGEASEVLLLRGITCLLTSSALLLAFPLGLWLTRSESWTPVFLLPVLVYPVLALQMLGWVLLSRTAREGMVRTRFLHWSAAAFAAGVMTIPLVIPGWFVLPGRWQFLVLGMFAYLPTVLGPVTCTHAVLFLAEARSLQQRRGFMLSVGGGVALVAVSIGGGAYQVALISSPTLPEWFFVINGLACLGYALVASGTRLESRDSSSFQRQLMV